jgi:adenylate kinase family enzyme
MIGPKGSGKSTVANELANRTNMIVLKFDHFLKSKGFDVNDFDDEEATMSLVSHLVHETNPRVLIEDFPRNEK